ncbi:hypothetical protein IFR04_013458 [Cadophora malorum]|uniref:Uncharacterized protein n=1 Tax=Cadophora malorum TaxID=108018 RepID=A0A8H7W773_9HELO|nr:hypothetical protein IFR04_013458 [Cadophora malorum]
MSQSYRILGLGHFQMALLDFVQPRQLGVHDYNRPQRAFVVRVSRSRAGDFPRLYGFQDIH